MAGVVAFAIVGKDNARLFLAVCDRERIAGRECDVHMFAHGSLDVVDEKLTKSNELYLGPLLSDQRYKSFGFVTNTGVKMVLVVDLNNNSLKDPDIRGIFKRFHSLYCQAISNPFYTIGEPLTSQFVSDAATELFARS